MRTITILMAAVLAVSACSDAPAPGSGSGVGRTSEDAATARGPRSQPGTTMGIYAPEQHSLYDGLFRITGTRVYQVGTLNDASPWDHMGDDGSNLRAVEGTL
ncbi:MAG TPA: hypothetical protein VK858_21595, partial [Longimicrobiales bacterium]|nr:hypothetical protein [Longimicrobiales bacterium]